MKYSAMIVHDASILPRPRVRTGTACKARRWALIDGNLPVHGKVCHGPPQPDWQVERVQQDDCYDPNVVAVVHHLCAMDGGTAIGQHAAIGFETIDDARSAAYHRSPNAGLAGADAPDTPLAGRSPVVGVMPLN